MNDAWGAKRSIETKDPLGLFSPLTDCMKGANISPMTNAVQDRWIAYVETRIKAGDTMQTIAAEMKMGASQLSYWFNRKRAMSKGSQAIVATYLKKRKAR